MSKRFNWSNVGTWARTAAPYVRAAVDAYTAYRSSNGARSNRSVRPSYARGRPSGRRTYRRPNVRYNRRSAPRARQRVYRRRPRRHQSCIIANNPRFDNQKWVRFSHIQEMGLSWTLSNASAATTFKAVSIDTSWLPPSGHNPLCEAAFDEFERKMLTKVTWKANNFRLYIATQLYQPAISQADPAINAPAQQTFDVQQKWGWKFWRFNSDHQGQSILLNTKEERATPFIVSNSRSQIFGTMHLGKARQMNWYTGSAASLRTDHPNLNTYLQRYMLTGYRGDSSSVVPPALPNAIGFPTLDIQLMPDDPYPNSIISNVQLVKCTMSLEFDIHIYSTWLCSKMTQN